MILELYAHNEPSHPCRYCTFAQPPASGRRAYMTMDEILQIASSGAKQGCAEALFTLGEASMASRSTLVFEHIISLAKHVTYQLTSRTQIVCHL